jgi:hypothetical protein
MVTLEQLAEAALNRESLMLGLFQPFFFEQRDDLRRAIFFCVLKKGIAVTINIWIRPMPHEQLDWLA